MKSMKEYVFMCQEMANITLHACRIDGGYYTQVTGGSVTQCYNFIAGIVSWLIS